MEKKTVAHYTDRGFGFPIILQNAVLTKVRGQWTPQLNYNELAVAVLRKLVELNGRLTGNQVRFIRTHFELTLQRFAARFGVSHPAVMKWEKASDNPTGMAWSTEKDLRLFVVKTLESSASEFLVLYRQLETVAEPKAGRLTVDAGKLAAGIGNSDARSEATPPFS